MIWLWLVVHVVAFAAVVAAMLFTLRAKHPAPLAPERIIEKHVRRVVVVSLKSGESFRGALEEADDTAVLLVNAVGDNGKPVDGALLVLRNDIAYVQLL